MPTTTGLATSFITFSRPGASGGGATVTDRDGKIKWAGHNLLLASESFDSSSWSKPNTNITANQVAAPNGTSTADLSYPKTSGTFREVFQSITYLAGASYTLGVYVKAAGLSWITFGTDSATSGKCVWFDVSTGTKGTEGTSYTGTITPISGGWYYITVSFVGGVNTLNFADIQLVDGNNSTSVTANGTNGVYLWGAHLYRSDLGGMQLNPAMPAGMQSYYPTTPGNLLGYTESLDTGWTGTNGGLQGNGSELITNGGFTANVSGWSVYGDAATTITWDAGRALVTAATTSDGLFQAITTVVGKTYRLTATFERGTAASVIATSSAAVSGSATSTDASGVLSVVFTAASTSTSVRVTSGAAATGTFYVDNVSVQEVPFYEAPNGLQTARAVEATAANGTLLHSVAVNSSPYTFSIWLKRKSGSGDVQLTASGTIYVTVPVTDQWQRFSTTVTPSAGNRNPGIRLVNSGDAVYAWGAQLSDSASIDPYTPVYGAAVTSAAYYAPRLDFDPVTLAAKGLLVEELRTNLLKYSNDFSVADWEGGVTRALQVTNNNAVSPDGGTTAAKVYEAAAGAGSVLQRILQAVSGTAQVRTISVYAKKAERKRIVIGENANDTYAWFDLDLGTCAIASGSAAGTPSITPVGNGWYRCVLTPTTSFGSATVQIHIITDAATSSTARVGDGASGVYLYGAQVDSVTGASASFVTSYVPTGSATATRAADVASVSTQAFPYSASEGTIVVSAVTFDGSGSVSPRLVALSDGTSNNVIRTLLAQGRQLTVVNAGSTVADLDAGNPVANAVSKVGAAFNANDFVVVLNAGAAATGSSGSIPSVNKMDIGQQNGTGILSGYIRQITYLPRRISNAELQSRTA